MKTTSPTPTPAPAPAQGGSLTARQSRPVQGWQLDQSEARAERLEHALTLALAERDALRALIARMLHETEGSPSLSIATCEDARAALAGKGAQL